MNKETANQNTNQDMDLIMEEKEVLKQFRELLDQQGMGGQSMDFMELFQYMAGIQLQLAAMTSELGSVRQELSQLRESHPKAVKENLMNQSAHLQKKITNLSERLSAAKDCLVKTAAQAISTFKEKGRSGMYKVLRKGISSVKSALAGCREQMVEIMTNYEKTANQIDSIGDELKQIGNSVSNVGRLLAGKGTKEVSDEKPGVGITRAVNRPVKSVVSSLRKNIDTIDQAIEKLNRLSESLSVEKEKADESQKVVTFTVAECGEFHDFGEYYEDITSAAKAISIFNQIPPERMNGIPSIGIKIHTEGTESYEDIQMDIVSGGIADLEILDYIPDVTNNPKAMEMIAELINQLPKIEVRGSLEKWQTARNAEEQMDKLSEYKPLAKIEELEECNYNMIDNVLNNEKTKEKKQTGRISIKEKLSEKRAVVKQKDRTEKEAAEKGAEKKTEKMKNQII